MAICFSSTRRKTLHRLVSTIILVAFTTVARASSPCDDYITELQENPSSISVTDLGDMSCLLISQSGSIASLIVSLSFICGIATVINSLFKFKQQRDNPTQIPIVTPISMFFVGVFMIYLPSIISTGEASLFGIGNGILGGSTGDGIDQF
ncbi:MAG: hypothetical protein CMF46_00610 [Legionellales bacterium]|nr:hypothetical protein [Legionellales bacterium]